MTFVWEMVEVAANEWRCSHVLPRAHRPVTCDVADTERGLR